MILPHVAGVPKTRPTYTGSGSPEFVQTGNPPASPGDRPETYYDSVGGVTWAYVGATAGNTAWIRMSTDPVINPVGRFGANCKWFGRMGYGAALAYTESGGNVTQFNDLTSGARHATVPSTYDPPALAATSGPLGGPVMDKDTANEVLATPSGIGIVAGDAVSIIFVVKAAGASDMFLSPGSGFYTAASGNLGVRYAYSNSTTQDVAGTVAITGAFKACRVSYFSSGVPKSFVNEVQNSAGSTALPSNAIASWRHGYNYASPPDVLFDQVMIIKGNWTVNDSGWLSEWMEYSAGVSF